MTRPLPASSGPAGAAYDPILPRAGRDSYPLSSGQRRLWFLDQLETASASYTLAGAVRLRGRLDARALEASFHEIVRRHETLRASFPASAGEPSQVVSHSWRPPLPLLDLRTLPPERREAKALEQLGREARQPFDLARGPLLRTRLIRLDPEEHLLFFAVHHTVTDGVSTSILIRELALLYETFSEGRPSPLPELPVQYADFAAWQQRRLAEDRLADHLDYWRRRLAGTPASLDLPTDRPRPARRSPGGRRLRRELPPEMARRLEGWSRERGATLFLTLLAAFQAVLARLSGQLDLVVGTPVAGRTRRETAGLIGFFVNTLVLRTRLGGDPPFRELLERVRETVRDALAHQELPFERLVEELRPHREMSSTPLFQVLFALEGWVGTDLSRVRLGGLEAELVEVERGATPFDLTLTVKGTAEGLATVAEYATDLFDRATVERLVAAFHRLAAAAVAEPERRLSELPLLGSAERHQLLVEWNDTATADPAGSLPERIERQAWRTPDAVAVVGREERVSYGELLRRAEGVAERLRRLGVGPEARVAVMLPRTPDLVAALLGVWRSCGAYVALDPAYPSERLALMTADSGASAVLTETALAYRLPPTEARVLCLDREPAERSEEPISQLGAPPAPESLAYLIYTSGSTGRPKGVAIEHRSAGALAGWSHERFGAEELSGVLAATSACFDLSVFELFVPLTRGGSVVLAEDALALAELPAAGAVSLVNTVPSAAAELLEQDALPRQVLTVNLAGEPLPGSLARLLAERGVERVYNLYGPSEDTTYSTWARIGPGEARPPIGRPIAGTRALLLDATLRPVPLGTVGELYLGGAGLARGYLDRPALTAERFLPDGVTGESGARLYRTGDLARLRTDGQLEFLGRSDRQVKLRGFRIELGEVEAVLEAHPEVAEAAVERVEGVPEGARLVAYFAAGGEATPAALRRFLEQRLPAHAVPSVFVPLERLPRTPNGKVDRAALPAPGGRQGELEAEPKSPRTPLEAALAEVWGRVLTVDRVGVDDDFFALGGHSFLALRLRHRLAEELGLELPLADLFGSPTVARLAAAIEARRGEAAGEPPIAPRPHAAGDGEFLPLSSAQERLWFLDRLREGGGVYNLPTAFRVAGRLDAGRLGEVFRRIVRRHEALRTRFPSVEGRPGAVVEPSVDAAPRVVDLRSLGEGRAARLAERLLRREGRRPFDLARGPLLRVVLLDLSESSQVLVVHLHHMVADAGSLARLADELARLYAALAAGRRDPEAELPELPVQYPDFALWQRRWLAGERGRRQLDYWRRQLADAPPLSSPPSDRPRPALPTHAGAVVSWSISEEALTALEGLVRRAGATLFMGLLTLFQTLLHRLGGQREVVVGTPAAHRPRPETEPLVGLFLNLLALRTDFAGDPGFLELLSRVRAGALGAYAHQELPFEALVEELAPRRSLARAPLFQTMLTLIEDAPEGIELPGAALAPLAVETGGARFDLTLALVRRRGGLRAVFEYATDLFDRPTVVRFAREIETLLGGVLAAPEEPVSRLPLLDRALRHQVLREWSGDPLGLDLAPIHRQIERAARAAPEAVAAIDGDRQLSRGELDRRADRLAGRLAALGAGPDRVVGICLSRSLDLVVGLLGILKAGAAYLPLDPSYPEERLRRMVRHSGACLLVAEEGTLPVMGEAAEGLPVVHVAGIDGPPDAFASGAEVGPGHLAYVIYTSGSTGRPKGVMVEHRNAASFFAAMDRWLRPAPEDTWLAVTSVSFDISVLELLWTLARGLRIEIHGGPGAAAEAPRAPAVVAAPARPVDLGLFYFAADRRATGDGPGADRYRLLLDGARFADRRGFAAVWTPERHFHEFGGLYPNPSLAGAALAAVTERIGIRAGSVVLPLHHPVRVAEEWSLVDNLSGGRVAVSFASGWHGDDFVLAPERYRERREILLRDLDTVRRLWRGEAVSFRGGDGEPVAVRIYPRPVQPELPVWLTAGGSPETFRAAGEAGANLLTHLLGQSTEELARKIGLYRAAWRDAGHGPGGGRVTLMLHTFVGEDRESVRRLVRGPFLDYLRSAAGLMKSFVRAAGLDVEALDEAEMDALLDHAFDRYFESSGLFGTPRTCLATLDRLTSLGVDEIACLIDFGLDFESTMAGLERLDEVRRRGTGPRPLRPAASVRRVEPLSERLVGRRATHLQCTPSMVAMLVADPEAAGALGALHGLLLGGEALPPALAARLRGLTRARLHNLYGPTETTVWSTAARVDGERITLGRPLANSRVQILDPGLRPMPPGAAGQLFIGGQGVARGYLGAPGATAERFRPDPFGPAGGRLYATGDLGRHVPTGEFEFLGRVDHQLKVRGHRIEPGEVEAALRRHPAVREAVVVGRAVEGDRQLVAYVVAAGGGPAPLRVRLDPAEQERLLAGRPTFSLPNGMTVAQHDGRQALALYREIFLDRVYLRHGVTLHDGDTILDVGANTGFFSLLASQSCRPRKIVAVEPLPPNCELLRINGALYGAPIEVEECAVAEAPGEAEFLFYPHAAGLSTRAADRERDLRELRTFVGHRLRRESAAAGGPLPADEELDEALRQHLEATPFRCPLKTLSQIVRDHALERIDLLKLDVERSEVAALAGIDDEDWPKIRQLVIEVHSDELLARTRELLEARGFEVAVDELMALEAEPGGDDLHVFLAFARRPAAASGEAQQRPLAPAAELSLDELRAFLRRELPEYMVPSLFVTLDALPLTPNGKVDRRALPPPTAVERSAGGAAYAPPADDAERRIAAVWGELLQVERIGRDDNFFEVGGTSLLLVQAQQRLKKAFDREISLVDLFRHPNVGALAEHLSGNGGSADGTPRIEGSRERVRAGAEARVASAALERQRRFLERRRGARGGRPEEPTSHG